MVNNFVASSTEASRSCFYTRSFAIITFSALNIEFAKIVARSLTFKGRYENGNSKEID